MTTAQQWREAALELRRQAEQFEQRAREVEDLTTVRFPSLCSVVSHSGPNGEPLACAYVEGHDGTHSWATLNAHWAHVPGSQRLVAASPTDDERPGANDAKS